MSLTVDIRKRFKGFTLDVGFRSCGAPLGILGASGSGKSMTLKCIAGIETPDEGHIEVNGRVLYDSASRINLRPQKRKIGYLFQNYALFPHMTVEQNIACAIADKSGRQAIDDLLERFELTEYGQRYPTQLSGGQQQRVALARILAYEPEVLLLDEPFSALDAHLKEALQLDMAKLLKSYDGDAIMVTHNRDEVFKLCDNLMALDAGQVIAYGDTKDMFTRPGNLLTARLTGCKNFSRAERVADDKVRALDWGCELHVCGDIPDGLTHIGIRAHYFMPCADGKVQNAIPVRETERIEGPFEWNVMFTNADTGEGAIWWKYAKDSGITDNPPYLRVDPESILLLES